jgi:hypothetical protein
MSPNTVGKASKNVVGAYFEVSADDDLWIFAPKVAAYYRQIASVLSSWCAIDFGVARLFGHALVNLRETFASSRHPYRSSIAEDDRSSALITIGVTGQLNAVMVSEHRTVHGGEVRSRRSAVHGSASKLPSTALAMGSRNDLRAQCVSTTR